MINLSGTHLKNFNPERMLITDILTPKVLAMRLMHKLRTSLIFKDFV